MPLPPGVVLPPGMVLLPGGMPVPPMPPGTVLPPGTVVLPGGPDLPPLPSPVDLSQLGAPDVPQMLARASSWRRRRRRTCRTRSAGLMRSGSLVEPCQDACTSDSLTSFVDAREEVRRRALSAWVGLSVL